MNRQDKIEKFISYAKCSYECAEAYLFRFDWDCDKAMHDYWLNFIITCDYDVDT